MLRRFNFNLFIIIILVGCTTEEQSSDFTFDDRIVGTWNYYLRDYGAWDRDTTLIVSENGSFTFKNKRSVDTCTLICEGNWKNITSEIDENSPSTIQYYRFDFEYCGDETCASINENAIVAESLTNDISSGWRELGIKFNPNGWSEFTMFDSCDETSSVSCIWTKE